MARSKTLTADQITQLVKDFRAAGGKGRRLVKLGRHDSVPATLSERIEIGKKLVDAGHGVLMTNLFNEQAARNMLAQKASILEEDVEKMAAPMLKVSSANIRKILKSLAPVAVVEKAAELTETQEELLVEATIFPSAPGRVDAFSRRAIRARADLIALGMVDDDHMITERGRAYIAALTAARPELDESEEETVRRVAQNLTLRGSDHALLVGLRAKGITTSTDTLTRLGRAVAAHHGLL
jgi:hypothetical protein